ncbi:hypothetical protein tb265_22890 [Gemmatimonadetes bacterium T265]|nr:hypothetical protein tb265_22890 [Gemmatimonadetes bacterium T265]
MAALLAVDLGVRAGFACWGDDGRLRWYRSQNFGAAPRMRRAVPALLSDPLDLSRLVVEGGGPLVTPWATEGERRALDVQVVAAEVWRPLFLLPREHGTGPQMKAVADRLARRVIAWADGPRPTSLRHDAAEAILIGLWGVLSAGWLRRLPPDLLR